MKPNKLRELSKSNKPTLSYNMSMQLKSTRSRGASSRAEAIGSGFHTKEYIQALRDIVVAIMIDKPGTVDTLEEVLSVKGIDNRHHDPAPAEPHTFVPSLFGDGPGAER
jgi:hypothetical protein